MKQQRKPIKKGSLKRVFRFVTKHYKGMMAVVILCLVISSVVNSVSGIFINLFTELIGEGLTVYESEGAKAALTAVMPKVYHTALVLVAVYLTGLVCNFTWSRLMAIVTQGTLCKMRYALFEKMEKLPISYFDTHPHGDTMSYYTNDIETLRMLITSSIPNVISASVIVVTILGIMLYLSVWLTLIVAVFVLLMFAITKFIGSRSAGHFVKRQKAVGEEEGYIEEMMNGQKVIKVFCHEEKIMRDFDKVNEELFESSRNANCYGNILMPILNNVGNLLYVMVIFLGSAMLLAGNVTNLSLSGKPFDLFVLIPFVGMTRQFSMNINRAAQEVNSVAMGLAGASRIFEFLEEEEEQDDGYVTLANGEFTENGEFHETKERTEVFAWRHPHKDGSVTYEKVMGDVQFFDVDFSYDGEKTVLHDISLYAKPGQKVAFVGATGAGKTTITNLINRFYDLADGKIRYDNININKIKKPDLRRSLGVVLQDTNLFTGTVMENIRYGRIEATDEEVYAAAKLANAHDFIIRLPNGYDTMLTGNGSNLSQGQRQLLSIARAAVADPPVMILDEATSSIDTRTEALVQKGMDSLMHGRTVFVIAHRLSTVRNADVIMVLENGRIIERGTHKSLLAEKGKYYELYTGRFELE